MHERTRTHEYLQLALNPLSTAGATTHKPNAQPGRGQFAGPGGVYVEIRGGPGKGVVKGMEDSGGETHGRAGGKQSPCQARRPLRPTLPEEVQEMSAAKGPG